jgi:hypothetical protein
MLNLGMPIRDVQITRHPSIGPVADDSTLKKGMSPELCCVP